MLICVSKNIYCYVIFFFINVILKKKFCFFLNLCILIYLIYNNNVINNYSFCNVVFKFMFNY